MKTAVDKLPATVAMIYAQGCDRHGWPRRVRWDKGKEGGDAIKLQLTKWKDWRNRRGTVMCGRSVHNTRIEGTCADNIF